ncbi:hypothetical protein Tco_0158766 [Tanacetum coccineum]
MLLGMDRLSKRKFGIVCHGKVVRIPLEGDEILRVHGEHTQRVVKTLMNTKVGELKLSGISVIRDFIDVFPEDLSMTTAMRKEEHGVYLKLELELLRKEKLYVKSSVKDKILATPSETSKVENAPAEMLRDLDQQMEKRADDGCTLWIKLYSKYEYETCYHPCKENLVIEALRGKERVKPRRVRAMAMPFNMEAYVIDFGGSYQLSIRCAPFEELYGRKCRSPGLWAEIGESSLIGPKHKPLEFEVGDRVMLKVSPWKGVIRFGKKGKLALRYLDLDFSDVAYEEVYDPNMISSFNTLLSFILVVF